MRGEEEEGRSILNQPSHSFTKTLFKQGRAVDTVNTHATCKYHDTIRYNIYIQYI